MYSMHPLHFQKNHVSVSIQKINSYPLHWDNCIEIILVLEGTVLLDRGINLHLIPNVMEKQDVYAIAMNELHRIYNDDRQDNLVLMLQIDGGFVRQNFPSTTVIEFDYFLNIENELERKKIEYLKQLVINLASIVIDSTKDDSAEIDQCTKELLFYLIDNYNRINATLNRTNDCDKYLNRSMRMSEYLINNAHHKNVLQEISEQEHFNSKFISRLFKNRWHYSIQDLVNKYRVVHASKMLLETDKNISDIAYECGFSAPRYLYKYFKIFYPQGPSAFRKDFQEGFRNIKYLKCFEEKTEIAKNYLQYDINKKVLEQDVKWLEIDANTKGRYFSLNWNKYINIKASDLADTKIQDYVELIQKKIGFQYIRIFDLFSYKTKILSKNPNEVIQYFSYDYGTDSILRFITRIGSKPLIRFITTPMDVELYQEIVGRFLSYCEGKFGKDAIKNWAFEIENSEAQSDLINFILPYTDNIFYKTNINLKSTANSLSNTIYTASFIVKEAVQNNNLVFLQPVDRQNSNDKDLNNCSGLISLNGLLNPSFHACALLSLLGEELIEKGDFYIITRKKDSIQILLYNHLENNNIKNVDDLNNYLYNDNYIKTISIHIKNIKGMCKVIRYEHNNKNGSLYYNLQDIEHPSFLNANDIELLNKIYSPKISFDYTKEDHLALNVNLLPYSIELITLDFVT